MVYPEYAEIDGKQYKLNTDFKVALKCFEVIEDDLICDEERSLAIIYLLYGFIPDGNLEEFLRIAGSFLRCGETQEKQMSKEKDMDFQSDEKYIIASFMSDYHIDLSKEDLHWYQYVNLIQGLTEHCVLSKVREVRNFDLSDIKDAKQRSKIIRAKESVKLPVKRNKEQLESIEEFENLLK